MRASLTSAALLASFSPLLMNLVGYDNSRWNALVCLAMLNHPMLFHFPRPQLI
jgi:hypothetical protein